MLALAAKRHRGGVVVTDPHWANVVSLLNFPGADGSATFTDAKGVPWSTFGNAQIDTSLGYQSGLFDGVGDYLQTPSTSGLQLSAVDFTIEAWVMPTSGSYFRGICGKRSGNSSVEWQFFINNGDNKIGFYNGTIYLSTSQIAANTLTHVEVDLQGTTLRIFINGVLDATYTGVSVAAGTNPVYVATSTLGLVTPEYYAGHIKGLRITKGVARNTSSFTPPSAPFPTS